MTTCFWYGLRSNVPEYAVGGGTTYRIVTDHLGSVRLVVNASTGGTVQRIEYDEFGIDVTGHEPEVVLLGFASQAVLGAITGAAFEFGREIGSDTCRPLNEMFSLKKIAAAAATGALIGAGSAPFFAVPETWIVKSPFVGLIGGYLVGRLQHASGHAGCAVDLVGE